MLTNTGGQIVCALGSKANLKNWGVNGEGDTDNKEKKLNKPEFQINWKVLYSHKMVFICNLFWHL